MYAEFSALGGTWHKCARVCTKFERKIKLENDRVGNGELSTEFVQVVLFLLNTYTLLLKKKRHYENLSGHLTFLHNTVCREERTVHIESERDSNG